MRNKYYPLADFHNEKYKHPREILAVYSGEFRPPKRGEWYLSGSIIEAYKARNDMTTPYHIAKIVRIKTTTIITITEYL